MVFGRSSARIVAAVLCAAPVVLASGKASGQSLVHGGCDMPPSGVLEADTLAPHVNVVTCGLTGRDLDLGDVTLPIPPPGFGVGLAAVSTDEASSTDALLIVTPVGHLELHAASGDQTQSLVQPTDADAVEEHTAAAIDGCQDDVLGDTNPQGIDDTFSYAVSDGYQPAGGTQTKFGNAIDAAGAAWYGEQSPCFKADHSTPPLVQWVGHTSENGNFKVVSGTSTCASPDGVSTVDTGNLDTAGDDHWVALNCFWFDHHNVVYESDIRLDTHDFNFTYSPETDCNHEYDVRSILTHEVGHTLGLKDKSGSNDYLQTMFMEATPCTMFRRTLGRQDVRLLRGKYPES